MKLRILDRPRDIGPNFNRVTPTLYPDEVDRAAKLLGFCGDCGRIKEDCECESERLENCSTCDCSPCAPNCPERMPDPMDCEVES